MLNSVNFLFLFRLFRLVDIAYINVHAVVNGEQSQLLGQIHIALLRLLQMDLEEAHATGAIQVTLLGLPQTAPCILTRHRNSCRFVLLYIFPFMVNAV